MRNFNLWLLVLAACFTVCGCGPEPLQELPEIVENGPQNDSTTGRDDTPGEEGSHDNPQPEESMTIRITVGSKVFKADIEASETGRAFLSKLPLTLDMSELNGNEKYCYGVSLPRADKHFGTIASGDLMLYSGNCIVLFYGPAGGYSYTRIGQLQDTDGLAAALGRGSVTVTFERE